MYKILKAETLAGKILWSFTHRVLQATVSQDNLSS